MGQIFGGGRGPGFIGGGVSFFLHGGALIFANGRFYPSGSPSHTYEMLLLFIDCLAMFDRHVSHIPTVDLSSAAQLSAVDQN